MIDRFLFHGFAVALEGHIRAPFDEIIPVQATSALPETGGYGSARVDNFRFREIVSCTAAYSQVAGAKSEKGSYDTLATVTVENLNILNMVTADRIVARVASKHPDDPDVEPSVIPLGSYFENLRIAGQSVELDLATDTFTKLDTLKSMREAYEKDENFRNEFDLLSLTGKGPDIPDTLRKYFPSCGIQKQAAIPERKGIIACSLVRNLVSRGNLPRYGHIIALRGFGIVRLAELKMSQGLRRITMLQVELGSMPEGSVMVAFGEGNGTEW